MRAESEQVSDLEGHKPPVSSVSPATTSGHPRHERPLWIWDLETGAFIWANSEGIKFWGAASLDRLQRAPFDLTHPAFVAVREAVEQAVPAAGADLELEFFHDNSTGRYAALCRPGQLQNRPTVVVELKGAAHKVSTQARRRRDEEGAAPSPAMLGQSDDETEARQGAAPARKNGEPYDGDTSIKMVHPPRGNEAANAGEAQPMRHVERRLVRSEAPVNPVLSQRTEDRLHELARLIKEAAGTPRGGQPPARGHANAPDKEPGDSEGQSAEADVTIGGGPAAIVAAEAAAFFDGVDIDMAALGGAGDMADIEALLDGCPAPLALISFQKIIHANDEFISAFGYGELDGLAGDGTDWILPQGRPALRAALEDGGAGFNQLETIRLRSGRRLAQDVFMRQVRLVKFDRVLLLIGLKDETAPRSAADTTSQESGSVAPIEDVTSIPLLSAISHEVRTPLNVIIGFSEIMAREEFGPLGQPGSKGAEKYHGYVEDIHNSAKHAVSLINDLLDLTKLRAGKWDVEAAPVDLNEIVLEQTRMMRGLAGQQEVKLRATLEENLPALLLDRRAAGQILINLISNAIKFSSKDGIVRVETELVSSNEVALTVSDRGRGMTEVEVNQAMKPFRQVDASEVTLGTGLGLPIAKALAEANGMEFIINSEKGVGTTVLMLIKVK